MSRWFRMAGVLILLSASFAHAKEPLSQAQLRSGLDAQLAQNCAEKRARIDKINPNKTPHLLAQARNDVELWCNCMPAEAVPAVERLGEAVPPEAAMEVVWKSMAICVGKEYRAGIAAQCPTDPDTVSRVNDVGTYCGCVGSEIAKLDDVELRQVSEQTFNDVSKSAKAKGEQGPWTPVPPAIRHFGARCPMK